MHPDDTCELTPAAQSELRSSATTLSAAELALLIRFDGNLTLQQLQASLSPVLLPLSQLPPGKEGKVHALLQATASQGPCAPRTE